MFVNIFIRQLSFIAVPAGVILMCTSCAPETKARMNIAYGNIKSRISNKKPQEELMFKTSPQPNLFAMQEKRLFMYRYYPELYEIIYKQRDRINEQSIVNWYAEDNRRTYPPHVFFYDQDPYKLYHTD